MILPPHCHRYGSHKQRDVCSADYHHQRYHVPHILGKGNPSFAFPYSLVVDIERVTPHFLCPTSRKSKANNFGITFNRRLIIVRFTVDMYPQSLFLILQGIHPATVQVAQQRQTTATNTNLVKNVLDHIIWEYSSPRCTMGLE